MNSSSQPHGKGLRLLALDNGGILGLSELMVLSEIMKKIQVDEGLMETPRPCDYFDLIGGSGTGGIIALMLGRLRLTTDDAINMYTVFASHAFAEQKWKGKDGLFKATKFEGAIKDVIKKSSGNSEELMMDTHPSDEACKTFVCAVPMHNTSAPHLFHTYQEGEIQVYKCKIWEAARATCALPAFFKSIAIGDKISKFGYINAGQQHSNPIKMVLKEAASVFGYSHQVACIVSIGCGRYQSSALLPDPFHQSLPLHTLVTLKDMLNQGDRTAVDVESHLKDFPNVHFRFNVEHSISLAEWTRPEALQECTSQYLQEENLMSKLNILIAGLRHRLELTTIAGLFNAVPGMAVMRPEGNSTQLRPSVTLPEQASGGGLLRDSVGTRSAVDPAANQPKATDPEGNKTVQVILNMPAPSVDDNLSHEFSIMMTPRKVHDQQSPAWSHHTTPSLLTSRDIGTSTGFRVSNNSYMSSVSSAGRAYVAKCGRGEKRWYAIFRGLHIGVYHEIWGNIEHFVKYRGEIICQASWRRFNSGEEAAAAFAEKDKDGETGYINT